MPNSEILTIEPVEAELPAETVALVQAYQRASKASATIRAYMSDVRVFEAWCRRYGFRSMPAAPETVAAFIVSEAEEGRAASTLGRRMAAIRYGHKLAKVPDPTDDEGVHAAMKGARRKLKVAPKQKAAATADILAALLMRTPDTLTGKRDRALLGLGFAGAFRRSELVALDVADLVEGPEGLRVRIRQGKTDQEGRGAEIAIPHGRFIRPVALVRGMAECGLYHRGTRVPAGVAVRECALPRCGDRKAASSHHPGRGRYHQAVLHSRRARCLDLRGALPASRLHHHRRGTWRRPDPHHGPEPAPGSPDRGRLHPAGERLQGSFGERVPVADAPSVDVFNLECRGCDDAGLISSSVRLS